MPKKIIKKEKLNITLVRSAIGFSKRQKATLKALGLSRINQTVEQPNNPAIKGMLDKVSHLIVVEEQGKK